MSEVSQPETPQPLSIGDVIADLQGFGIEDFEEILTLNCGGRKVDLRISNITTEEERLSLIAVEEYKGYAWMTEVKCEILSRSISMVNGVNLRSLSGRQRLVRDPVDDMEKDIQVVLRQTLKGWGQEIILLLWRVLMVHSQSIEDKLFASFPTAATITEAERRFNERAEQEVEEETKTLIRERVAGLFPDEDGDSTTADEN